MYGFNITVGQHLYGICWIDVTKEILWTTEYVQLNMRSHFRTYFFSFT